MKAPAFWYRKPGAKSRLLSPLGQVYRTGALLRRAVSTPYKAKVPVICVGNIVAGGAGKTPSSLALRKLIAKHRPQEKIAFVTRGYGGSEKGPLRVDLIKHTARDVGDEALLLAKAGPCWIGRDRAAAIREAEKEATLIILDDGLQNPKIAPDINLLVVDGAVGFGNQKLIPAGPLRETMNDAFSRIDGIVMIGEDKQKIATYLGKPVLNAKLRPSMTTALMNKPKVLAFAGIGRPQKFYDSCREAGLTILHTQDFPDHYAYSDNDIADLLETAKRNDLGLITTAKDMVRIPNAFKPQINVLEVELIFEDTAKLLNLLQKIEPKPSM